MLVGLTGSQHQAAVQLPVHDPCGALGEGRSQAAGSRLDREHCALTHQRVGRHAPQPLGRHGRPGLSQSRRSARRSCLGEPPGRQARTAWLAGQRPESYV